MAGGDGDGGGGGEEEEEEEEEDMFIPDGDDIDPEVLASLPPSVQMEVMLKMRERRVAENREHFQSISGNMRDFSEMQMATYLKSTQLKRKMETVIKGTGGGVAQLEGESGGGEASENRLAISGGGGEGGGFLRGKRIASAHDREFVFSKPVVAPRGGGDGVNAAADGSGSLVDSLFGPRKEPQHSQGFHGGGGRWGGGGRGLVRGRGRGVATVSLAQAHPSERRRSVSSSPP